MPIKLTAVETFPIYESDGTSTDHDFGTIQFISASGQILGQLRVLMSDLDLGGATAEEMRTAVEAAGEQPVAVAITAPLYLSVAVGAFVLGGQAVGLRRAAKLTAGVGSFALAGQSVSLNQYRLVAGVGSFALAGQNVNLS